MRRRRSRLQVSLFPFLSVLLCMLGSLIMLLLIFDAKARQQRQAEAALQQQRAERERRQRQQELERRLAAARRRRNAILEKRRSLLQKQAALKKQLTQERQALVLAQKRAEAGRRDLERYDRQLFELRSTAQDKKQLLRKLTDRRNDLAVLRNRLAEELTRLEQLVESMRQARREPLAVRYVLRPYRGPHGTLRQPIYLVASSNQITFQPDGETLWITDLIEAGRLESEIRERYDRISRRGPDADPYALVLIRPSGIPLYYRILRALRGTGIDYGYEFVEEGWQFDFGEPPPTGEQLASGPFLQPGTAPTTAKENRDKSVTPGTARGKSNQGRAGSATARSPSQRSGGGPLAGLTLPRRPAGTQHGKTTEKSDKQHRSGPARTKTPGRGSAKAGKNGHPARSGDSGAIDRGRIVIECRRDSVIVRRTRDRILSSAIGKKGRPLRRVVQQIVALLHESQPLTEPEVRFVIHADGLRSYYRAASALSDLQLRTSWEIVDSSGSSDSPKR